MWRLGWRTREFADQGWRTREFGDQGWRARQVGDQGWRSRDNGDFAGEARVPCAKADNGTPPDFGLSRELWTGKLYLIGRIGKKKFFKIISLVLASYAWK